MESTLKKYRTKGFASNWPCHSGTLAHFFRTGGSPPAGIVAPPHRCTHEYGQMVIVPEEAVIGKTIYQLYLSGRSSIQIANELTEAGIPTALNEKVWWSGSVLNILHNERYCGDVLMQKTITVDCLSHKVVKNNGREPQYLIRDHHQSIISRSDWTRVQSLWGDHSRYKGQLKHRKSKPIAIKYGHLKGFIPLNPDHPPDTVTDLLAAMGEEQTN